MNLFRRRQPQKTSRKAVRPRKHVSTALPSHAGPSPAEFERASHVQSPPLLHNDPPRDHFPRCGADCPLLRYLDHSSAPVEHESLEEYYTTALNLVDQSTPVPVTEHQPGFYSPLTPWQTRLVKLVGFDAETGYVSLDVFPVEFTDMDGVGVTGTSETVTYTALSHVWGIESNQTIILCNGHRIAVPRNLAEALCYLVDQTSEKYLWIDTLCINQTDNAEKAFQVRNMLRVFEKATKVIAWIGNRALMSRHSIFDVEKCFKSTHASWCLRSWELLRSRLFMVAADELWTRTWCRQEIFAAKTLVLLGSDFTIPSLTFECFHAMLEQCTRLSMRSQHEGHRASLGAAAQRIPATIATMAKHYKHAGTDNYSYTAPLTKTRYTVHWLRHLRDGTAFQVTDQRDRVYGIFGMVSSLTNRSYVEYRPDINPGLFPISYTKSVSEVYQDLVKYLINTDKNLDVLTVFEDRGSRSLPDELPSWTTDWRRHLPRSLLAIPPSRKADQQLYSTPPEQNLQDVGRLTLVGLILFEIQELSSYQPVHFNKQVALPVGSGMAVRRHSCIRLDDPGAPTMIFGSAAELDSHYDELNPFYMRCKFYIARAGSVPPVPEEATVYVPRTTRIGDVLVLLGGARFPFVLRRLQSGNYHLVGPALNGPALGSRQMVSVVQPGDDVPDWKDHVADAFFFNGEIAWEGKNKETFVIV